MKKYEIVMRSGECMGAYEYKQGMTEEWELEADTLEEFDSLHDALAEWERKYTGSLYLPRKIGPVRVPDVTEYELVECEYDDDMDLVEYRILKMSDI